MVIIRLGVGVSAESSRYYTIEGLNVFALNDVPAAFYSNLQYDFLKNLSKCGKLGCFVGYERMRDLGKSFEDIFGKVNQGLLESTLFDIVEGEWYEVSSPKYGGLFLSDSERLFSNCDDAYKESIDFLIRTGAIGLTLSHDNPFSTASDINEAMRSMLIWAGHDGITLDGPSSSLGFGDLIIGEIVRTVEEVNSNSWFIRNRGKLKWNYREQCLLRIVTEP